MSVTVKNLSRGGGAPTGDVTFLDGTTVLGTAPIHGGQAKMKTSSLSVGRDPIQVVYSGGRDFVPSTAFMVETILPPRALTRETAALEASHSGTQVLSTAMLGHVGERTANPTEGVPPPGGLALLGTVVVDQDGIMKALDSQKRRNNRPLS